MSEHLTHKTAIVDKGAKIGKGTKIWHFTHINTGAKIGKDCTIGQNCFISEGAKVGDGVKIQNNVSIFRGVVLEDNVFCGPSVVFTNVKRPRSSFPRDPQEDFETTVVKEGATIGANSTVICGVSIGAWAFIGAGSLVTTSFPDFALVLGSPAKQVGWVCKCGQKLYFSGKGAGCNCGRSYRMSTKTKLEEIEDGPS